MNPKILYYSILNFQKKSLNFLNEHFDVITLKDPDEDTPDILAQIHATFAPLGFFCGKEKLDLCLQLKAIVSNTTGEPHIDVEYARTKNIAVISLKNEQEFLSRITPTAEHTWGLLLSLVRRTPWAFESVKQGIWNRRLFPAKAMLSNMRLGIIGMGRLGSMVARYGNCFGMHVQYFDPYVGKPLVSPVERIDRLVDLVAQNDVISLHAPHNPETDKMINRKVFNNFKIGAYFINTARAEIVDFDALLKVLENGRLSGAAMDVFEGEFSKGFSYSKKFQQHPLIEYAHQHDNLLITPHIGGSTYDAWRDTEMHVIKKLTALMR